MQDTQVPVVMGRCLSGSVWSWPVPCLPALPVTAYQAGYSNTETTEVGNVSFNDALNAFYLQLGLNGVRKKKSAAATWATLSD